MYDRAEIEAQLACASSHCTLKAGDFFRAEGACDELADLADRCEVDLHVALTWCAQQITDCGNSWGTTVNPGTRNRTFTLALLQGTCQEVFCEEVCLQVVAGVISYEDSLLCVNILYEGKIVCRAVPTGDDDYVFSSPQVHNRIGDRVDFIMAIIEDLGATLVTRGLDLSDIDDGSRDPL